MRSKIRLINICIRHKCTNVQDGISKKSQWKKVRLKTAQDAKVHREEAPTSKNAGQSASNSIYNSPAIPDNFEAGFCKFAKFEGTLNKSGINVQVSEELKVVERVNFNVEMQTQSTELLHQLSQNNSQKSKELPRNNTNVDINLRNDTVRVNEVNMQMLPKLLHEQLFGKDNKQERLPEEEINSIKKNLSTYGINVEDATRLPDVNLKLPILEGKDISEPLSSGMVLNDNLGRPAKFYRMKI